MVVFGPGHPWEEVVVSGFADGFEELLGILKPVGADDEAF